MAKKPRVNPSKLKSTLISIQSRFETGKVDKMADIGEMYMTGMIAAMGIGNNGYITKFNAPENFTVNDLLKLADISNTDVELIWKVVKKQALQNYKKRDISNLLGDEESLDDNSK
ncbi:hypothetical protein [Mucilaginibacter sp.]|jgi:hypothetical protein|uniref:hypothetical protein n=1 Tax=Mucilaginibacter sp. TaxID=1882438 RepID=UPI0035692EC1